MKAPGDCIARGLSELGLPTDDARLAALSTFLDLLIRWNRTYNLTAIREPSQMVTHHLLDSLAILPHISGRVALDVGTGAGLPGLPLALYSPDMRWTLVDTNGKKTRFVTQAAAEMGLANVTVVQARVEEIETTDHDLIVTRAFASLPDTVRMLGHLLTPGTRLLAMKAGDQDVLPEGAFSVVAEHRLEVPSIEAARKLVEVRRG